MVFIAADSHLGSGLAHLLDASYQPGPFAAEDQIALEAWCESGVNHTLRVRALWKMHTSAGKILRDQGLDPYEDIELKNVFWALRLGGHPKPASQGHLKTGQL
jgi:hypothetical protein